MSLRARNTTEEVFVGAFVTCLFLPIFGIPYLLQVILISIILWLVRPGLFRISRGQTRSLISICLLALLLAILESYESSIMRIVHDLIGGWIVDVHVFHWVGTIFVLVQWFGRNRTVINFLVHFLAVAHLFILGIIWLGPITASVNVPQMVLDNSSPVLIKAMYQELPEKQPLDELRKIGTEDNPSARTVSFKNLGLASRGKDANATARFIAAPVLGGLPFAWFFSAQLGMVLGCVAGAGSWRRDIPRAPIVWGWIGLTLAGLIHITSFASAILGSLAGMVATPMTIGLNNFSQGKFLEPAFANLMRGFLSGTANGFLLLAVWNLSLRRLRNEGRRYHRFGGLALAIAGLFWLSIFQIIFGGGLAPSDLHSRFAFAVYQIASGVIVFYMGHANRLIHWIIGGVLFIGALLSFLQSESTGISIGFLIVVLAIFFFFRENSPVFPREWGKSIMLPLFTPKEEVQDFVIPQSNRDDDREVTALAVTNTEEPDSRMESLRLLMSRLGSVAIPSLFILILQQPLVISAQTTAVPPISAFPMSVSPIMVVEQVLKAPALQGGRLREEGGGAGLRLCADTTEMLSTLEKARSRDGEICGPTVPIKRVKAGELEIVDRFATASLPQARSGDHRLKYAQPVSTQTNLIIYVATAIAVVATVGPNDGLVRMLLAAIIGKVAVGFSRDRRELLAVFNGPLAHQRTLFGEVIIVGRYLVGFLLTIISWIGIDLLWSMLARVQGLGYFGLERWMLQYRLQFGGIPYGFPTIALGDIRDGLVPESVVGSALTTVTTLGWPDSIVVMPMDLMIAKLTSSWLQPFAGFYFFETGFYFFQFMILSFFMTLLIHFLSELVILASPRYENDTHISE